MFRNAVLIEVALVVVLACAPSIVHAQIAPPPSLRGRLLDAESNEPIALGRVLLLSEAGDTLAVTLTRSDGFFLLGAPHAGDFFVNASLIGYQSRTVGVFELGEDGEIAFLFPLRRETIELDELLVSVSPRLIREAALIQNGFFDRLTMGIGHFITPGRIEQSYWARTVIDLVGEVPGIEVEHGGIAGDRVTLRNHMGSLCGPDIYLDGVRLYGDLNEVPLTQVEAMEVYTRAVQIPIQWSRLNDDGSPPCGVVALWTKR